MFEISLLPLTFIRHIQWKSNFRFVICSKCLQITSDRIMSTTSVHWRGRRFPERDKQLNFDLKWKTPLRSITHASNCSGLTNAVPSVSRIIPGRHCGPRCCRRSKNPYEFVKNKMQNLIGVAQGIGNIFLVLGIGHGKGLLFHHSSSFIGSKTVIERRGVQMLISSPLCPMATCVFINGPAERQRSTF